MPEPKGPKNKCNACMIGMCKKCSGTKETCWCAYENHFPEDESEEDDLEE